LTEVIWLTPAGFKIMEAVLRPGGICAEDHSTDLVVQRIEMIATTQSALFA
jgi:hypothetical protein